MTPVPTDVLEIAGSDGRTVRIDRFCEDPAAPVVLVLHGFKGFRRWGFFPWFGARLAAAGFCALVPDFSHNGVERRDFDRLDLFLLDTWTRHQEDLDAIFDALGIERAALLGHSRGGTDALLFAARRPEVRAVVTLAAVADTGRAPPDAEETLRRLGYYPIPNSRTGQTMPVARTLFDDGRRHDVGAAVARYAPRPLLLVHGEADESVPPSDLDRLAAAHGEARTLRLPGAGHTFGAGHPFAGASIELETIAEAAESFLREHLPPAGVDRPQPDAAPSA